MWLEFIIFVASKFNPTLSGDRKAGTKTWSVIE